jgi:toxin ParE1/3/4
VLLKSPQAVEDIDNIWLTIALDKPRSADEFARKLDDKFNLLESSPLIGRIFNPQSKKYPKMRMLPIGKYLIFYSPIPNGVKIYRVLHGAMDIGTELGD